MSPSTAPLSASFSRFSSLQPRNLPSVDLEEHARQDQLNPDDNVLKITRWYHLFNRCANKYVRITDRNRVDARGRSDSQWGKLIPPYHLPIA
jgi:hypothetical protein